MTPPLAWLNGRLVPAADLAVSAADAGFVSGATVTDFARTYRRRLFRWPAHLARLRADASACGIPLPYSDAELTAAADELVAVNGRPLPAADELAVVTFATPGPLGHLLGAADDGPPTAGMSAVRLPVERYRRFYRDGVTLAAAGTAGRSGVSRAVKHRSRLDWWLADRAVRDPGSRFYCPGGVAVLTDPAGNGPDAAIGGVLAVVDGAVYRSPPGAVLEGVSLGVVGELCRRLGVPFVVGEFGLPPPAAATEMLLAGSGLGLAGVRAATGPGFRREFDWPGPVYRRLAAAWAE